MKTREEFAKFLTKQIEDSPTQGKYGAWHYGVCELRELADWLYGETPQTEEEKIHYDVLKRG